MKQLLDILDDEIRRLADGIPMPKEDALQSLKLTFMEELLGKARKEVRQEQPGKSR
ncbi:hypothetical protein ACFFK0_07060 [Paenibacillus chartarius]|uniref:Transposase n=1 Tax=Paenibacillus chartarius TaxID=747481 RepID=A0ABV6DHT4_9BACL